MKMYRPCLALCIAYSLFVHGASAFGPLGHATVGAIADQRLDSATAAKVKTILDGMTLERAALLADDIKEWDSDPPSESDTFHLPAFPNMESDLIAYHTSNPHHRDYHFCDIPVEGSSKYNSGPTGRSDTDIVHMIPIAFHVLDGSVTQPNPHNISKRVAIALLAHFIGDLHQPLHVGAEYFDSHGKPTNPDLHSGAGNGDVGGNNILITFGATTHHPQTEKLHVFWDDDAVKSALRMERKEIHVVDHVSGAISKEQLTKYIATHGPTTSTFPAGSTIEATTEIWANDIMPIAREAHARLSYNGVHINSHSHLASADAEPDPTTSDYAEFAGTSIKNEIPLAGARLADVLKAALL